MSSVYTGGGIGGTAVDPLSPSGVLINPSEITNAGLIAGHVMKSDGAGNWIVGPAPIGPGSVNYRGTWNANTNTPDLTAITPTQGDYYVVSVAGSTTLDGITDWEVTDWAIYNGTIWQKVDNTEPNVVLLEFSTLLGVPGAGTRFLDRAGVACTTAPVLLPDAVVLKGMSVIVNVADAARNFSVDVVTDPAGVPVVVGSLSLTATNTSNRRRDLSAVISAGALWGVRVVRTSGAGASTFADIRVEVEVKMP